MAIVRFVFGHRGGCSGCVYHRRDVGVVRSVGGVPELDHCHAVHDQHAADHDVVLLRRLNVGLGVWDRGVVRRGHGPRVLCGFQRPYLPRISDLAHRHGPCRSSPVLVVDHGTRHRVVGIYLVRGHYSTAGGKVHVVHQVGTDDDLHHRILDFAHVFVVHVDVAGLCAGEQPDGKGAHCKVDLEVLILFVLQIVQSDKGRGEISKGRRQLEQQRVKSVFT